MNIFRRIYEDYFKRSRLPLYEQILIKAKAEGYHLIGIYDFFIKIKNGITPSQTNKFLVSRHDIDTSPKVARKMFEIEKKVYGHEGSATYYFRDCTIDCHLIHEIDEYLYETGYHYEEIASFEKKHKLKSRDKLITHFDDFRRMFLCDLSNFRKKTKSKSITVASHGDFINKKYQLQNYEFLQDKETRLKASIELEAYDFYINQFVKARYADHLLLENFYNSVIDSINNSCNCILMLTHPRNWKVDIAFNSKDNIIRFIQGIKYKL